MLFYFISVPLEFGGEFSGMSVMCRTVPMECQFPFTFKGVTYHKCTQSLLGEPTDDDNKNNNKNNNNQKTEEGFLWCATKTDTGGNMLPEMWGMCDIASCKKDSTG
jgi:hypothetical protein